MHMRIVPVRFDIDHSFEVAGSNSALRRIIPALLMRMSKSARDRQLTAQCFQRPRHFSPRPRFYRPDWESAFLREAGDQNAATGGKELVCNGGADALVHR